jgi:hypothetical protein
MFNFAPYRIINIYIRGAIPEYFSSVFLIAILIFLHLLIKKKTWWSYLGLAGSIFGIIMSHPMNVFTSATFIGPYFLYLLAKTNNKLKLTFVVATAGLLGVLLSAYYLLPLLKDVQYFFYGSSSNHYTFGSTLGLNNFFDTNWYYFLTERNEILSRGHFIKTGLIEFLLLLIGFTYSLFRRIKKQQFNFFDLSVAIGLITLFLTTKLAEPIYKSVDVLSNIQFPWRMLSTFILIPPIILAYLLDKLRKNNCNIILGLTAVFLIAWNRFPEIYGKNFTFFPQDYYYFTVDNLHSTNMNTIWTTKTTEYAVHQNDKVAILEGEGLLHNIIIKNSKRTYQIKAANKIRMIDYTFYYPGWKVFADGVEIPIEFQDLDHKGVITYWLPAGDHNVEVVFTQTKTVLLANLLTISGIGLVILIVITRKKLPTLINKSF